MTKIFMLIAVAACSKTDDKKPPTADPWATGSAGADPWAAPTAVVDPEHTKPTPVSPEAPASPPSSATGGTSAVAGSYSCQTLRYGTLVNGMHQSAYVASALGAFEIDADGAYRSASYPDKGSGRTHAGAATITFEGGPYAGYIGEVGRNSTGAYIRFGEKPSEAPAASMHFNDHVCYR